MKQRRRENETVKLNSDIIIPTSRLEEKLDPDQIRSTAVNVLQLVEPNNADVKDTVQPIVDFSLTGFFVRIEHKKQEYNKSAGTITMDLHTFSTLNEVKNAFIVVGIGFLIPVLLVLARRQQEQRSGFTGIWSWSEH